MMPTGAHARVATSRAPKANQGRAGIANDSTARAKELRNKGRATCHRRSPASEGTECCCPALRLQQIMQRHHECLDSGPLCKQIPIQHASKPLQACSVSQDTCSLSMTQPACRSVVSGRAPTCGLAVLGVEQHDGCSTAKGYRRQQGHQSIVWRGSLLQQAPRLSFDMLLVPHNGVADQGEPADGAGCRQSGIANPIRFCVPFQIISSCNRMADQRVALMSTLLSAQTLQQSLV